MLKKHKRLILLIAVIIVSIIICFYIFCEWHESTIKKIDQDYQFTNNVGIKVYEYKAYKDWGILHIEGKCDIRSKRNSIVEIPPIASVLIKYEDGSEEPTISRYWSELMRNSTTRYVKKVGNEETITNKFEGSIEPRMKVVSFSVIIRFEIENDDPKNAVLCRSSWVQLK